MSHLVAFYCLFGRYHAAMHFVKKRPFGELNTYVCIVFGLPGGFISQNKRNILFLLTLYLKFFPSSLFFNRVKFKNKI